MTIPGFLGFYIVVPDAVGCLFEKCFLICLPQKKILTVFPNYETPSVTPPKKNTPLHRDPKQQELGINLRTRFDLGPFKDSFWSRTLKMLKKHCFYRLGPQM